MSVPRLRPLEVAFVDYLQSLEPIERERALMLVMSELQDADWPKSPEFSGRTVGAS